MIAVWRTCNTWVIHCSVEAMHARGAVRVHVAHCAVSYCALLTQLSVHQTESHRAVVAGSWLTTGWGNACWVGVFIASQTWHAHCWHSWHTSQARSFTIRGTHHWWHSCQVESEKAFFTGSIYFALEAIFRARFAVHCYFIEVGSFKAWDTLVWGICNCLNTSQNSGKTSLAWVRPEVTGKTLKASSISLTDDTILSVVASCWLTCTVDQSESQRASGADCNIWSQVAHLAWVSAVYAGSSIIGDEIRVHAGETERGVGTWASFAVWCWVTFAADAISSIVESIFALETDEGLRLAFFTAGRTDCHSQFIIFVDYDSIVHIFHDELIAGVSVAAFIAVNRAHLAFASF